MQTPLYPDLQELYDSLETASSLRITVVVPVRNGARSIEGCIEAIFAQSIRPHEVIVVDGGSTDGTLEMLQDYPVTVVHETGGTVGAARQMGVEKATGEYIAFTDSDCIPDTDWLRNLIKEFKGDTVGVGGSIHNVGHGFWETSIALTADTFLGSATSIQGRVFPNARRVRSVSGCNSIYRLDHLRGVGGFDRLLSMNEDSDVSSRISKLGSLVFAPDAKVVHDQRRGLRSFAKQMYAYGRGRGEIGLLDIQCVPAYAVPVLLLFSVFYPPLILLCIGSYTAILLGTSLSIAMKQKNLLYTLSLPVVYVVEHLFYITGFWSGLTASIVKM